MSHHIIEAKDLSYTYPDGTNALKDVSFRITHGESVAVIGENGAGKSTLLLHMNGYIIPQDGSLLIGNYYVTVKTKKEIHRTVGMVFQNPDDQLFMPTVFEDVAFGPVNLGLPEEEVRKRVEESLITVGMLHLAERPPYRLSAGEKRGVSIAAVLATYPDILVMDEPGSGLDPKTRRALINLLLKFEHTKIIATHDLDMALDVCKRTIVMHDGQIVADGNTVDILNDEELLERCSLEKPLSMQREYSVKVNMSGR